MDDVEIVRTKSKLVYSSNTGENTAEVKIVQFYINNTDDDIFVMHRNNIPITIPASSGPYSGSGVFVMKTVYHLNSRSAIVNTINNMQAYKEKFKIKQDELEILLAYLIEAFNKDKNLGFISLAIEKEISLRTIRNHRAVYAYNEDLLICSSKQFMSCPHPYSQEGQALNSCYEIVNSRHISGFFIELIDNEMSIKNRYIYAGKEVIEIPATQDKNKPSGVYFTRATFDKLDQVHLEPKFMAFKDAETDIGLFKTTAEAITGGNPELISKTEEERAKRESIELKLELERAKNDFERSELEHKSKLAELERDNTILKEQVEANKFIRTEKIEVKKSKSDSKKHKLDMKKISKEIEKIRIDAEKARLADHYENRKLQRNDFYDDRSLQRKDGSEFLKVIGAAIVTGLGVYGWMRKS